MTELNEKFLQAIVQHHGFTFRRLKKKMAKELAGLHHFEEQDLVLIGREQKMDYEMLLEQCMDKTGVEAFWNEMNPDRYFRFAGKRGSIILLLCGLHLLLGALREKFPERHFVLLGSTEGKYVSLRFHQLRAGESWLSDSLEEYEQPVVRVVV